MHDSSKIKVYSLMLLLGVEALVNPFGPTIVNDITSCVSEIITNNFKKPGFLIFANTRNVSTSVARVREELLKRLHAEVKFSIEVKSPKDHLTVCDNAGDNEEITRVPHKEVFQTIRTADYIVVVIDSYKDFAGVASRIIRSRSWNPHAKFIILLFHLSYSAETNKTFVERILTCLFKYNVINIVVVVPVPSNIRNAVVYSWKPYDPPEYCGYFNETAENRLLVEDVCEKGVVKFNKDVYDDKIPKDMKGCFLSILAIERQPFISADLDHPNIEMVFINEMADLYKFQPRFEVLNGFRGERNDLGEWDGALTHLVAKRGQLLLGGIFPDFDVHEDFECSSTYLFDSYTWVVPRAFPSPPYIALIIIFQSPVWYSAIGGFFVSVFSWKLLGLLSKDTQYHTALDHCFLNAWVSMMGFAAYARPIKNSLRVFFVFFSLYCILFLTAYQTKLIDVLKNPTSEEQVDTIEELVASGFKFGGSEELHDLFYNSSEPFDYFLGENWEDVDNISKALIDVVVHRNFSVLCSRLELAYMSSVMPELSDSSGEFKYFVFEADMFVVPMEMVALRGFAFMKGISTALERLKQSGVNAGVRRYFTAFNMRRRAKLLRSLQGNKANVNPLSLQHLQGGFLALALGYVGGTLVLTLEIIVNSKYVRNKINGCKNKHRS